MRLDVLLAERNLAETRSQAQGLIMAGQVRVNGQVEIRPGAQVAADVAIKLEAGLRFVSRGGEKLEPAFTVLHWNVEGCICADAGASTGGFTDCLLQHGAAKVYAIDVGYGLLHWKLRSDPRVVVMERTNARYVEILPEPASRVTVDASFISLKVLLPVICKWFGPTGGELIALVKPQFEAGRRIASKGEGVIQDPLVHAQVLEDVLGRAVLDGYRLLGLIRSPLLGPKGNTEFLAWLGWPDGEGLEVGEAIASLNLAIRTAG